MNRPLLSSEQISSAALKQIQGYHAETVAEVAETVAQNKVVVVGMSGNPFVKKARKALDKAGVKYAYLEYGSYWKGWRPRLAIKLWSGWPTYPQVFSEGKLIGGYTDLALALEKGELKA